MSAPSPYPAEVRTRFRAAARSGAPVAGARVGRGGDRRLGGDVELWLAVDAAGRIERAGFRAFGCPYTVAAADLACERVTGRPLTELLAFDAGALIQELEVPPERFPVRIWIEDAMRAAARSEEAT